MVNGRNCYLNDIMVSAKIILYRSHIEELNNSYIAK